MQFTFAVLHLLENHACLLTTNKYLRHRLCLVAFVSHLAPFAHIKYQDISEKGGPVFRPVVKSRLRTVPPSISRQASISAVESQNNNPSVSTESHVAPSISQSVIEPSGYATTHPESPIMVDRSNSIPIVDPTSSRFSLRPPLISSSSSNNFIFPPSSLSAVTEAQDLRASTLLSSPSVSASTIDPILDSNSTVSILSGVNLQRNQSSVQTTTVQSANVFASTGTMLTPSSTIFPTTEEDVPDASTCQKRTGKSQSKALKGTTKRKVSSKEEDDDKTIRGKSPPSKQRRTRASSGTPRPRKRAPSPPPYDPTADPGEDIDPTSMTMAALCTDTGQGRVSRKAAEILSNHAAWKAKNREKRADMRALMELKKYGREEESEHQDDGAQAQPVEDAASASIPGTSNTQASAPMFDDTGNGFDYSQGLATSRYNVQVRIGPNGETVIDEESLVVDRVENDGTGDYTHVIESDHTKFVNSGTYAKRYRGSRWSAEETELFYNVSFILLFI